MTCSLILHRLFKEKKNVVEVSLNECIRIIREDNEKRRKIEEKTVEEDSLFGWKRQNHQKGKRKMLLWMVSLIFLILILVITLVEERTL